MLGRDVGTVELGEEQDNATMKPRVSLVTLGMELPTTETLWPDAVGIAAGVKDAIVATEEFERDQNVRHEKDS